MTTDVNLTATKPACARPHARPSRILAFPVPRQEPGRVGRRLATLPGEGHPVWTYLCGRAARLRGDRRVSRSSSACSSRASSCTSTAWRRRRGADQFPRPASLRRTDRRVSRRLDHGRRRRPADRRRCRRARCRPRETLAPRRLSAPARSRSSPGPIARRRSSSTGTARRCTGSRTLPVNASYPSGHTARRSRSTAASPC